MGAKSNMLGPCIVPSLPKLPIAHAIGIEPTVEEVAGIRSFVSGKVVGPDEVMIELLMLGLKHDKTALREICLLATLVWPED